MNDFYGDSGKTPNEILREYQRREQDIDLAIDYISNIK
jgi:hypothetical protein